MRTKVTYLVGSIQDTADPNASRDKADKKLVELGFEVLNPCKLEVNQTLAGTIEEQKTKLKNLKKSGHMDKFDDTMDRIIDEDLVCVVRSDFLVVLWDNDKKHGGTLDEIYVAISLNKPIYVVHNGLVDFNDWTLRRIRRSIPLGTAFFPNVSQLLDHIQDEYKDYIKVKGQRV